jgi:phospholipid N-methyltransferase
MSQHSSILRHPPAAEQPRPKSSKPDWLLMLGKFFRHGKTIASFVPSSRFLSKKLIKGIDWDKSQCIVELGAGTGPVTRQLVRRAKPHTKLVVIEQDPDFCRRLRDKFPNRPNLEIVEGDACKLDKILADRGIKACDHVLSGLPLPSFPAPLREAIMAASHKVLPPHGEFRQLTNMPWIYFRMYKNYFNNVRFSLVPLNLPPAGVYFCSDYKGPQP